MTLVFTQKGTLELNMEHTRRQVWKFTWKFVRTIQSLLSCRLLLMVWHKCVTHMFIAATFTSCSPLHLNECLWMNASLESRTHAPEPAATVQNRPSTYPLSKAFYLSPIKNNCLLLPDQATYTERRTLKHPNGWKQHISEYEYIDVK